MPRKSKKSIKPKKQIKQKQKQRQKCVVNINQNRKTINRGGGQNQQHPPHLLQHTSPI